MNYEIVMPVLISFAISVLLSPVFIPFLRKLKFSQYVRNDGPGTHLKKAGTPTMGGIIILISIAVTSCLYIEENKELLPVLFLTLSFGLIGFLDDYIKIVMCRSMGLLPSQKLLLEGIVTSVFAYYLLHVLDLGTEVLIPFTSVYFDLGKWYLPLLFLVVLGTVNGVNFTDGLDGLATGITVLTAAYFSVAAIGMKSGIYKISCAATGSLLGFLIYNVYPARVFMGDTGSLALGGFIAACAFMLKMPLFIAIIGIIYLIEVISVMMQIGYFKITKGKRIFKMAPIHHHLELSGWSETQIVAVFSIITAVFCLIGIIAL